MGCHELRVIERVPVGEICRAAARFGPAGVLVPGSSATSYRSDCLLLDVVTSIRVCCTTRPVTVVKLTPNSCLDGDIAVATSSNGVERK